MKSFVRLQPVTQMNTFHLGDSNMTYSLYGRHFVENVKPSVVKTEK